MPIILYWLFLCRKINLSGISLQNAADPDQIRYTRSGEGLTTFREFWARLTHFGKNGGWDESRGERVFCGNPDHLSATSQNLAANRSSVSRPWIRTDSFENFYFICPQNLKCKLDQTGTSLTAGHSYWMYCREILFTQGCSPRGTEFPRSGHLFRTKYGCVATGRQSCPIFGFWPIFPIENL